MPPSNAVRIACLISFFLLSFSKVHAVAYQTPQDRSFTATFDGTEQRYVLRLPPGFNSEKPHDLLIALHGHGSDRWQFATHTRSECRGVRDIALKHEMIFVSPDYRAKTSWMGPSAEADVVQLIDTLKTEFRIERVILAGGSMGASASLSFAAMHPEFIDGVVALNGTANHLEYENFQEAIAASFGGTKSEVPEEYKKRSAEYWPLRLTMPIAVTTSGKDTAVPPDSVIRLAHILKALRRSILHIHRPNAGHETTYDDTVAAMNHVLNSLAISANAPDRK